MWVAGGVVAVGGGGGWVFVLARSDVAVRSMNSLGLAAVGGCGGRVIGIDVVGWVVECALRCAVVPAAVVRLGVAARGGRWWRAKISEPGGVAGRGIGASWRGWQGLVEAFSVGEDWFVAGRVLEGVSGMGVG